ncbi:hypothetical protein YC2023_096804 [Brassica napus]
MVGVMRREVIEEESHHVYGQDLPKANPVLDGSDSLNGYSFTASRSGGSLAPPINPTFSWGSSPAYPPPYYSQPPLQRLNSSSLSPRQVSSSQPRVRSSTIPRAQVRGTMFETQQKKVKYIETVPGLARTGSVSVRSNHPRDFPKGFDGYPGPAIMLLSPPPSSLPIPRFTIKPKLRCNAELPGK